MIHDTFKHKGMRRQLLNELKERGVGNAAVLEAMEAVPRHIFLDNAFVAFAYQDKAFPIGSGQTISQPSTVAFQTTLLDARKGEKVLEIGTGSGYQTSVLCALGLKVYSIERQKALFDRARISLDQMGYAPKLSYGDGYKGWPVFAPFHRILVTAGAPFVPQALLDQLMPGGKLVIPVGEGDVQEMQCHHKLPDGSWSLERHGAFRFVPLLEEKSGSAEQ
jgi:protein-L-isoaspartate(D-aspartate) O-methyltransferase